MKRRQFMQLLAASGMAASFPINNRAYAATAAPDHFLVMVNAGGGWDPTSLCDPKGTGAQYPDRARTGYDGSINSIDLASAKQDATSGIRWSGTPNIDGGTQDTPSATMTRIDNQFDSFFQTYANRMTVINGIDNGTNNHSTGNRATWSGNPEMGYPSLAAIFAAAKNPSLPMAYISNGGYDFTASLVSRARASSAGFIDTLAAPNNESYHYRSSEGTPEADKIDIYQQLKAAQAQRLARQQANETLPLRRKQLNQLFTVRQEENNLAELSVRKDQLEAIVATNAHMNNRNQSMKQQASLVSAAFAAGIAASANINSGGFDTHGDHDRRQYQSLGDLLEGTCYLMEALQAAGVADKTTVVIGSDFGRTPYYNSGNGKDHWPVTSLIVLHPSGSGKGGKVFGASDDKFSSLTLNLANGQPDSQGEILTPAHINLALRKELNIDQSSAALQFPISASDFNIFS